MIAASSPKLTLRLAYDFLKADHKPKTVETYGTLLNHWERAPLTITMPEQGTLHLRVPATDPDLSLADNVTLSDFKSYLATKVKQNTVRKHMKHLAVILHRIGPPDYRHPEGLGLISKVPYAKPPKEILKPVVTVEPHEIANLYRAAESATWPHCEVPAPLWWQTLIVTLYNIGLRRLDYLSARQSEFDLVRNVVTFDAEKTSKTSALPLHPVVVSHLKKIWEPYRELVWPWRYAQAAPDPIDKKKTSLYAQWRRLLKAAKIKRPLTPHDLRRTCGSDLWAQSPAAASECLQHSSIVTTQRSYVNCSRETRDLMLARNQPPVFTQPATPPDRPMILKFPKSG